MTNATRLALVCALAACVSCGGAQDDGADSSSRAATPPPVAAETQVADQGVGNPGDDAASESALAVDDASSRVYSRLPDPELRFDFDVRLRSDKSSVTANGNSRRGLAVECEGVSEADLWSRVDAAFEEAGYRQAGGSPDSGNGTVSRQYAKNGVPTITVSQSSSNAQDEALIIWLGWDV